MKSSLCAALVSLLLVLAASCMTSGDPVPPTDEASQTASPPAGDDLEYTEEDLEMLEVFGEQCGAVVCSGRTHCCNASCSRCAPFGVECPQVACLNTEPAPK